MSARAGFQVVIHGIVQQGSDLLLGRRANTGYGDGHYSFVAGHLEKGETLVEGLVRELNEEAGIRPVDGFNLLAAAQPVLHIEHLKDFGAAVPEETRFRQYYEFYFRVGPHWQGQVVNAEPEKCDHLDFFAPTKLPKPLLPLTEHALGCLERGERFSRFGWDNPAYPAWKARFG